MKAQPLTFEHLPIGARFRWAEPPFFGGDSLDGEYVKGGAKTFGDSPDWQPWDLTPAEQKREVARL